MSILINIVFGIILYVAARSLDDSFSSGWLAGVLFMSVVMWINYKFNKK